MKVYITKPAACYSGGCIIIAAQSSEEAQQIANEAIFFENGATDVTEIPELQTTRSTPGVIIDETYFE